MDINLHAYGNAQESQENGSFKVTCQHGDLECKLNTIANCVGHMYKKKKPLGLCHIYTRFFLKNTGKIESRVFLTFISF